MHRLAIAVVMIAGLAHAGAARELGPDDPAAIGARMTTHAETAGLKDVGKPIITATGATCSAGGTIGQIQSLFFDVAGSEPNLDVTSVTLRRASETMMAKSVLVEVEYTVDYVAQPDEAVAKRRWSVPALLNTLLGGSVAAQGMTIVEAKIASGVMTLDARSMKSDASKAMAAKLDAGAGHLVTTADVEQRTLREVVRDPNPNTPQRAVTSYAFKISAKYDPSPIRLDVLKRLAYN